MTPQGFFSLSYALSSSCSSRLFCRSSMCSRCLHSVSHRCPSGMTTLPLLSHRARRRACLFVIASTSQRFFSRSPVRGWPRVQEPDAIARHQLPPPPASCQLPAGASRDTASDPFLLPVSPRFMGFEEAPELDLALKCMSYSNALLDAAYTGGSYMPCTPYEGASSSPPVPAAGPSELLMAGRRAGSNGPVQQPLNVRAASGPSSPTQPDAHQWWPVTQSLYDGLQLVHADHPEDNTAAEPPLVLPLSSGSEEGTPTPTSEEEEGATFGVRGGKQQPALIAATLKAEEVGGGWDGWLRLGF